MLECSKWKRRRNFRCRRREREHWLENSIRGSTQLGKSNNLSPYTNRWKRRHLTAYRWNTWLRSKIGKFLFPLASHNSCTSSTRSSGTVSLTSKQPSLSLWKWESSMLLMMIGKRSMEHPLEISMNSHPAVAECSKCTMVRLSRYKGIKLLSLWVMRQQLLQKSQFARNSTSSTKALARYSWMERQIRKQCWY